MSDSSISVSSASASQAAARSDDTSPGSDGGADRAAPGNSGPSDLQQQARLFRSLMGSPTTTARELAARQLAELAARGGSPADGAGTAGVFWPLEEGEDGFQNLSGHSHATGVDVSAMLLAQHSIDQGPGAQPAAAAGAPDPTIAELIERHVRRALASVQAQGSADGEVHIELSDSVFPGTALSLRRTAEGWQLSATADNRQSLDRLNQFAPALVERFARASLGHLSISLGS